MKRFALSICCTLLALSSAAAQELPDRPKIGLALAGGGAKGISHIGVLKALEEMNVPIDYVAGTSMGSIIGGLYASGMGPDELAETIAAIDWADVMRDDPPRRELSFRRKEDDQRYLLDLEVGVSKSGIQMPAGLQTGQKLTVILQWLTRNVADIRDFSDLPTPFRCVAADINTGDAVVLESGDLAWAMRASMAIPSIFTPVTLDGHTLVDGGIVNNVPVDVVRAMGADIVIAVDLGAALDSRSVTGWFGIYRQMMRMLTRKNMDPRLRDADIVLRPPGVSAYGTLSFGEVEEIYQLGLLAVENKKDELAALSIPAAAYRRHAGQHKRPPELELILNAVRLEGNERVDSRIIEHLVTIAPGDVIDFEELATDVNTMYGLGDFSSIAFRLEPRPDKRTDLVIVMKEKPWGPSYMHFGLFLESDLDGDFQAAALVNLNMTRLNAKGAELRTDLRLGRRSGVTSELFQPLGFEGHWFVSPVLQFERRKTRVFSGGQAVAQLDEEILALNGSVGYQSSRFDEGRLGLEWGTRRIAKETGSIDFPTINANVAGLRATGRRDSLDDAIFPTSGVRADFDVFVSREEIGADQSYNKGEVRYTQFLPRGRSRVFWSLEAGLRFGGNELPFWDLFTLGGFGSLSGFKVDELRGQYKGAGRLGYYRLMGKKLNVGGFLELGNVWQDADDISFDSALFTGTVFAGTDSRVGPVILAYGLTDDGNGQVYLTLGRVF